MERNRARRVLREILRLSLAEWRVGVDILVLPRQQMRAEDGHEDYHKVREELLTLFASLGLRR